MATNYQRGSEFERQVKKKLEAQGYYVMRSAGSHTVVDVLAIKEDSILLIQCKTSNVETIPDLKQLFKSFKSNGDKTNIQLFEEMRVPALKLLLWKGKGRNNTYTFQWTGVRWITSHILEYTHD